MSSPLVGEWDWLESEAVPPDAVTTRDTGIQTDHGPILVGVDAGGARHLLLPAGDTEQIPEDRGSRSVVLVPQPLEHEGSLLKFADLVCVEPELRTVYERLAEDVVGQVRSSEEHGDPPAWIAYRVLNEWRDLLARGKRLGRSKVVGLAGELEVMRLAYEDRGITLLDSWRGPQGDKNDFVSRTAAAEVKATTAREGRRVEIHGLEQLARNGSRDLYLVYVRLAEDPRGITLFGRVERLLELGLPRRKLLELLDETGYQHVESAESPRLTVSEVRWYAVDDEFPAITHRSFSGGPPLGIERLRYEIDLDVAGRPLDPGSVAAAVGSLS